MMLFSFVSQPSLQGMAEAMAAQGATILLLDINGAAVEAGKATSESKSVFSNSPHSQSLFGHVGN